MRNQSRFGLGPVAIAAILAILLTAVPTTPVVADGPHQLVPDCRLSQGAFLLSSNVEGAVNILVDVFNDGNGTASGYKLAVYESRIHTAPAKLIGRQDLADIPPGGRLKVQQVWLASKGVYNISALLENTNASDPAANDMVNREVCIVPYIMADAGPDQVAREGEDLTFNGSASMSHGGAIVNYTWTLGDGTVAYGPTVTHNYTHGYTQYYQYAVFLTVIDGAGRIDNDLVYVYINPKAAAPPTADAGTAPSGSTWEAMSFNASGSLGNITNYIWQTGDGGYYSTMGFTHTYYEDGTYNVSLVIVDNRSYVDADHLSVDVANRAPVVEPIEDITTDLGVAHQLLVMGYDRDGYIASYSWDFGDGQTSSVRDPVHTWTSDGPHTVKVNLTDNDGSSTVETFYVNVTDVAPVASFTVTSPVNEGGTVRVDGSGSSDPGSDIVKYEWDWENDGTYDNDTGPVSSIVYWKPGYYNITLRVTDGEGSTNTTMHMVEVRNVAPTALASRMPPSVMEGENITFNASQTTEPGNDIVNYTWDFDGDGVFEFVTTEVEFVHVFTKVGNYRVIMRAWDEDGTYDDTPPYAMFTRISNSVPLVNDSTSTGLEGTPINVTVDVYEPGGDLADYYWDFDLDGTIDAHTNVSWVHHTWWESGTFYVWVNVTDIDHTITSPSWGAGQIRVVVDDVAPVPKVADGQATEGVPEEFTVEFQGTETNISMVYFDLDKDGEYELSSTTATTALVFTTSSKTSGAPIECRVKVVDTDGSEGFALFNVYVYDVAPTVTGPSLALGGEGQLVKVTVTAEEPGMDIAGYAWDWNADGTVDEETEEPWAEHAYNAPGAKRVLVTVTDEDGSTGTTSVSILVANMPPVADAGTPPQAKEGVAILLSAANSTEPGDDIVQYEWDYDGDGVYDFVTGEAEHWHAWDAPGRYNLRLRVVDADGTFGEDTVPVEVVDVEPVARLEITVNAEDRDSVLDGSGSYDAGGIVKYVWNISASNQVLDLETQDPVLMFPFDRRVEYAIALTVHDDEGNAVRTTETVPMSAVVTKPPVVGWSVPDSANEGAAATFRAWAEDPYPEGLSMTQIIEYRWEFGDGGVDNGPVVTHVFQRAAAMPYIVKLTVVDEDDDQAGPYTFEVTVINAPPIVSPIAPLVVKAGGKGEVTIEAQDVTSAGEGLTFSLGATAPDWSSLEGRKLVASPGKGVKAGTYPVPVVVTDVLGATTEATAFVIVTTEASEAEGGIGWGAFFSVIIPLLVVFFVLAVIVARRSALPSPPPARREEPRAAYEGLYGDERPSRRRARPAEKVEADRVDVAMPEEGEVPSYVTALKETPYEPPPVPEEAPPAEPEAPPPLPSWMTPSEPRGVVEAVEKEVAPPPPAPEEWKRPSPEPSRTYGFRKMDQEKKVRYRGSGPPK